MKRFFLATLALMISFSAWAQSSKVTATITDATNNSAVIGAVFELAPADDADNESKKKYYTSGGEGDITITGVAYGKYKVKITYIGYADKEMDIEVKSANTKLGTIAMEEGNTRIETVVKTVQAIRASQSGDTISYNADAFKVASDADVEGLLKKMPGITVSDGTVTAQGETIQKIFVDGKEFFGDDVATAISTLPAQSIQSIEVFNKLSDQAEFSGREDGDSYKALNLITRENMRQGVFGKVYAGYGYQPETDRVTDHNKYMVGGNVNIFNGNSRTTVTGLLNNINQQNFSFQDILGVAGGGMGGRGGGMGGRGGGGGGFMMGRQGGIANVASLGLNYSNNWKNNKIKLQASYFYNRTRSKNLNDQTTWYEAPLEHMGTKEQSAFSDNKNYNHRLNARFDWRISSNQSIMARTNFSFQGHTPFSETNGYQDGTDFYNIIMSGSEGKNKGYNFSQSLLYNLRLNDKGSMLSFNGNVSYRDSNNDSRSFSTERTIDNGDGTYNPYLRYLENLSGSSNLGVEAGMEYTLPISKASQFSFEYEFDMTNQDSDRDTYNFGNDATYTNGEWDPQLSNVYTSDYIRHNIGPSFNWSKNRNNIVVNLNYQYSTLDGYIRSSKEQSIKRSYNDFTYFVRGMFYLNQQHSINFMASADTNNPGIQQLNSILDISDMQYMSRGNENLDPAYSHMVMLNYNFTNLEKGRTLMLMGMFNTSNNYIGQSLYTGNNIPQDVIDEAGARPTQFSTYENVGGQMSLGGMLHYGFPINFLKSNMNFMFGVNYSESPSLVNGVRNIASNMCYNGCVTLGSNISENVDFTIGWNGNYNLADNSLAERGNKNEYFSHSASANLKAVFWKGFTFTANASYVQNIGYTNDYNDSYVLVNAYVGKKLFKSQLGELLVGVNDIFNQNTAFSRSTGSGFTQNTWNSVIGRYFTVQFTYNLRAFGKKGSQNISDYETQDRRRGFNGMPGGQGGPPAGGPPAGGPPAGGPPMGGGRGPGGFGGGMR